MGHLGDGSSPPGLWLGASGPQEPWLLEPLCARHMRTQVDRVTGGKSPGPMASFRPPRVFGTSKKSPIGVRPESRPLRYEVGLGDPLL